MSTDDSKLQDSQRRRLSVSAVQGDNALHQILATRSKEFADSVAPSPSHHPEDRVKPAKSNKDQKRGTPSSPSSSSPSPRSDTEKEEHPLERKRLDEVPRGGRRGTELMMEPLPATVTRPPLKKLADAAMSLTASGKGVTEVTVDMVAGLLSASTKTFLVFGDPADGQQRGFDHKRLATAGTLVNPEIDLQPWGVGYACKKGFKPESPNQDDFFVCVVDDWRLIGVFDGHGPYGHDVSSFVHRTLPYLLLSDSEWEKDPLAVMRRCFVQVHQLLEANAVAGGVDCSLSGTTGTVVLIRDGQIYCAWVGDSRAIICGEANTATDLSRDHKPTLPEERARIESLGGEVRKLEGDIPHRVFIRNRLYPGLAMSRAIGDAVGAVVGVTSEPEVVVRPIEDEEKETYLIVASDGVWEFIETPEAAKMVLTRIHKEGLQKATSYLAYEAWRRWVQEEESVVDDVTCVVVKLK